MQELSQYEPLTEIRTNLRFATYRGELEGEPVFIKVAASEKTRENLTAEAAGLMNMGELDPGARFYKTPHVIESTRDYIVTNWADGEPMGKDFHEGNQRVVEHLGYLADLFAFVDSRTNGGSGINRFNRPGKKHGVDDILERLESVNYARHIDAGTMRAIAAYARGTADGVETRFTNGDLQPGNLLIDNSGKVTAVDCESCSWLWPRHYNIVNLIFNYGSSKDWLRPKFAGFFDDYCQKAAASVNQETIDTCNLSAAMRCLQIVYENLGNVLDEKPSGVRLTPRFKNYVETTAQRILSGQLFFE